MRSILLSVLASVVIGGLTAAGTPTISVVPNLPSPQRVGTSIGLAVNIANGTRAKYEYRYSVSVAGGPYHVISDFSPTAFFVWSPELYEHEARVRATVRNADTKESFEGELPFRVISRVKGAPAVTGTANPLVALFSAPPCPAGSEFQVAFKRADSDEVSHTAKQACRGSISNNVYVAGMRADTDYEMRSGIGHPPGMKSGAWLPFHTGLLDGNFPRIMVNHPRTGGAVSDPLTVLSLIEPAHPAATDQDGNIVWYMRGNDFLTRILPGGRFLTLASGKNSENSVTRWQVVREVDLAGNVIRETNIRAIAEQLEGMGIKSSCKKGSEQCVPGFHHEAIRLPNGHILAITGLERMLPAGTQGAKGPVDVLGDLIVDLDEDFKVAWVWNSFDHLDLKRKSLSDEKCKAGEGAGGCPPVFLADEANGWLHSNSLNYVPSSGDLVVSIPEQDWVVKIDYKNGKGSGNVLWRLGSEGDFTVKSDNPTPWFSYQHDVGFEPAGSDHLTLLDDGHRRKEKDPKANNRGQMWQLDEQSKTATLLYNADLALYSMAVGSAQTLSNGGYSFEAGLVDPGPALYSESVETSADGKVAYSQRIDGTICYRSFRVPDLYSTPKK